MRNHAGASFAHPTRCALSPCVSHPRSLCPATCAGSNESSPRIFRPLGRCFHFEPEWQIQKSALRGCCSSGTCRRVELGASAVLGHDHGLCTVHGVERRSSASSTCSSRNPVSKVVFTRCGTSSSSSASSSTTKRSTGTADRSSHDRISRQRTVQPSAMPTELDKSGVYPAIFPVNPSCKSRRPRSSSGRWRRHDDEMITFAPERCTRVFRRVTAKGSNRSNGPGSLRKNSKLFKTPSKSRNTTLTATFLSPAEHPIGRLSRALWSWRSGALGRSVDSIGVAVAASRELAGKGRSGVAWAVCLGPRAHCSISMACRSWIVRLLRRRSTHLPVAFRNLLLRGSRQRQVSTRSQVRSVSRPRQEGLAAS